MVAQPLPRTSSARLIPVVIAISLLAGVGCGETYDLADRPNATQGPGVTDPEVAPSSAVDPLDVPVAADADLFTLFAEMLASWRGLDQRVIDSNRATDALARIESIWAQTEPVLRRERPTALFGFEQALDLARSAVERRRPADASKGLLIVTNLTRNW
jgi:hypothetical protein